MARRFKILAITDGAMCPTGYGNQANVILSELVKRGWDVVQLAGNYWPNERTDIAEDGYIHYNGIKLIPNEEIWSGHLYGTKESIRAIFDREKPDVVWTLNDFYRVAGLTEIGEDFVDRWVHWLPVDSPYGHDQMYDFMNRCKNWVFLSYFGWTVVAPHLTGARLRTAIYHAVQPDVYFPMENKADLKRKHGFGNRFVIASVGRNQPRKMMWRTAEAVAEFLRRHEDAVWVCKADPDDVGMKEWPNRHLRAITDDVSDRVLYVPQALDFSEMNDLYNSSDVFFHISGGEGFGIPYVEAMMAGIPCILSDNTTSRELLGGVKDGEAELGWLVDIEGQERYECFGNNPYDIANVEDALAALEAAYAHYKSGNFLSILGKRAREHHLKWCSPDKVVPAWEEIFKRIIRWNNKVLWHTFLGRGVGFSNLAEGIMPELEKLGYDVYCHDWQSGTSPILTDQQKGYYEKFLNSKIDWTEYPQIVCWLMESFEEVKGKYKLGWSLTESTKLPSKYVQKCNVMDYIITSSEFNRKNILGSGVLADVRIVPPCVNPNYKELPRLAFIDPSLEWVSHLDPLTTRAAPGSGGLSTKPFTFLHVGVVQERKNPDQALDGYVAAFPDDGRTKFILKSNHFGTLDWFRERYKGRKDIEFLYTDEKPLTESEMLDLYQRADVYVNLSHGEGIGMPDLEALATGLPVIGSNWDTRGLFLTEETGFPVKIAAMDRAYQATVPEDCGNWAYFDGQDYIRLLKEVAANPQLARAKGMAGAKLVDENFRPRHSARAMDEILMDVYCQKHSRVAEVAYGEDYYTKVHKYDADYYAGACQTIVDVAGKDPNMTVLDMGCGRGYLMKHLLNLGMNVQGIDISEYAVQYPVEGCEGRIKLGSVTDVPYPDQSVDFGISFSVLEHLPEKDVIPALKEIARVCKRAFLLIAVPLFPGHAEQLRAEDPTHVTIKPRDWWVEKFAQVGLEVEMYDGGMKYVVRPKKYVTSQVRVGDRVLVGIPTKDRLEYLTKLLQSLRQQTFPDFDVMIVDDSRFQHLPEDQAVLEAINGLMEKGHNVYGVRGVGQNQASAHNKVLNHALSNGYKLVYRCDDDITLEPDFLERIFQQFVADEKCQFAAMGGIYLNPYQDRASQMAPPDWRQRPEFAGSIDPCVFCAQVVEYPDVAERTDIQHLYSSYFYRPELVAKVGGFPTDLTAMGFREETLPIYELWLQGASLKIVTGAVGWHFNAQTGGLRSIDPNAAMRLFETDEKLFRTKLAGLREKYGRGKNVTN